MKIAKLFAKRGMALLLAVMLCVGMLGTPAFAANPGTHNIQIHYSYNGSNRTIGTEVCTFTPFVGWYWTVPSASKYQSQFPANTKVTQIQYALNGNSRMNVTEGQVIDIYSTGMALYFILESSGGSITDPKPTGNTYWVEYIHKYYTDGKLDGTYTTYVYKNAPPSGGSFSYSFWYSDSQQNVFNGKTYTGPTYDKMKVSGTAYSTTTGKVGTITLTYNYTTPTPTNYNYSLTWDFNDGKLGNNGSRTQTITTQSSTHTFYEDKDLEPTRSGYTFAGWTPSSNVSYTKSNGQVVMNGSANSTVYGTMTAQWTASSPSKPTADQVVGLSIPVNVNCSNSGSKTHTTASHQYTLRNGTFYVGEPYLNGDTWLCPITVYGSYYRDYFKSDYGNNLNHTVTPESANVFLSWDGSSWYGGRNGVTFGVACETPTTEKVYVSYVPHTPNDTPVSDPVTITNGQPAKYTVKNYDDSTINFKYTGYVFKGWTLTWNGGDGQSTADPAYAAGNVIDVSKNIVLHAVWEKHTDHKDTTGDDKCDDCGEEKAVYLVEWIDEDNPSNFLKTEERKGFIGEIVKVEEIDKAYPGYTFDPNYQFTLLSGKLVGNYGVLNADGKQKDGLRLYFKQNTYTVTYWTDSKLYARDLELHAGDLYTVKDLSPELAVDENGKTSEGLKQAIEAIIAQHTAQKEEFAGWATTKDGEVVYKAGAELKMPADNVNLYAVWKTKSTEGGDSDSEDGGLTVTKVASKKVANEWGDLKFEYTVTVQNTTGRDLYGLGLEDVMTTDFGDTAILDKDAEDGIGVKVYFLDDFTVKSFDYGTKSIKADTDSEDGMTHNLTLLEREQQFKNGAVVQLTYTVMVEFWTDDAVNFTLTNTAKAGSWHSAS